MRAALFAHDNRAPFGGKGCAIKTKTRILTPRSEARPKICRAMSNDIPERELNAL